MTIWEFAKASIEKRKQRQQTTEKLANPIDKDLPLGLHIDGKVEINLLIPPEGLSKEMPVGAHIVKGFSVMVVNNQKCFRVLLNSESGDSPSYLWIIQEGKEMSIRWYVPYDEIFPENKKDWDFWLSKKDGSIGLVAFKSKEEALFQRLWIPETPPHIDPVKYREVLYLDRYDDSNGKIIEHRSMLYGRKVESSISPCDEYAFLSASEERDGSYVSIDVGIDLDPIVNIKVVY